MSSTRAHFVTTVLPSTARRERTAGALAETIGQMDFALGETGAVLLAEDMEGTGHSTRVIGDEDRFTLIIPLSD